MTENLFYLSGPHGSGKTTFSKSLVKAEKSMIMPELYSRNIKFNEVAPEQRQALKIASRAIENYEYQKIARSNGNRIVLGNRCIYDVIAYNLVHLRKGWINQNEFDTFSIMIDQLFKDDNSKPYAIVLNPGIDAVTKHLHERWKKKDMKWREDDLEYAKMTCEAYEMFTDNPKIHYIDHEVNLNNPSDIIQTLAWIEKRFKPQKLERIIEEKRPEEILLQT